MLKVLDLFAGTQSVRKALDKFNVEYEYYGIDIYSPEEENIIQDLTSNNVIEELIGKLPKGWKPDFIWASPVCNKFSVAITGKGGNYYFEVKEKSIIPRENWDINIQPHMINYPIEKANYEKPTTIYSSKDLQLKECNHKGKHKENINDTIRNYADRARVPEDLVNEILEKILFDKYEEKQMSIYDY